MITCVGVGVEVDIEPENNVIRDSRPLELIHLEGRHVNISITAYATHADY